MGNPKLSPAQLRMLRTAADFDYKNYEAFFLQTVEHMVNSASIYGRESTALFLVNCGYLEKTAQWSFRITSEGRYRLAEQERAISTPSKSSLSQLRRWARNDLGTDVGTPETAIEKSILMQALALAGHLETENTILLAENTRLKTVVKGTHNRLGIVKDWISGEGVRHVIDDMLLELATALKGITDETA